MNAKYPNLRTLEEARATVPSTVIRNAREVASRTNSKAWLDTWRNAIVFGHEHGGSVVLFDAIIPVKAAFDPVLSGMNVDSVVARLNLAKVKPATKEKWRKQIEREQKQEKHDQMMRDLHDRRGEADRLTRYRYDKASMGKHYKRVVPVS